MMPIDIFKRPIFSLSLAASTCTFTAQGLAFVSLPFFFHTVLGRSATDTGILLTAWPLALATIAPIAGRLADRYHAGVLGAIGLTSMTVGPGADGAAAGRSRRPPTSCGGWCCAARASASSPRPTTG